jgi:hypothetical protein
VCNQDFSTAPAKNSQKNNQKHPIRGVNQRRLWIQPSTNTGSIQLTIKTLRNMRIPDNPIHPMVLFWCLVYALALFLIFVTEILWQIAGIQKIAPAKSLIRKTKSESET